MKHLYFDCFSGISGDMTLGALIDLGVPQQYLKENLDKLGVSGYTLKVSKVMRNSISGKKADVNLSSKTAHHHRNLSDIEKIISKSGLNGSVKDRSIDIFSILAMAEAKVHNKKPSEVHFHEVGAVDSIVDIVGTAIGVDFLGVDEFSCSSVPTGSGFVKCAHGIMPVPAPATTILLEGVPLRNSEIEAELTTPTGAAIIKSFVEKFSSLPAMNILKTGYGAGTKEFKEIPNLLRLVLGETLKKDLTETVSVVETNIDDMNPEWTGFLVERLFDEGALDVAVIPAYMKKARPGSVLQVVCREKDCMKIREVIFTDSTTSGVRFYNVQRAVLERKDETVSTSFGKIRIKVFASTEGRRFVPEYEECRKIALKEKLSLRDVYQEIIYQTEKIKKNNVLSKK